MGSSNDHDHWMRRALQLARRGWGRTSPNPMVGAVVVRDGREAGTGFHRVAGGPHAEVEALRDAGADTAGTDVYVTLEPCCTHGRTPPCTDALIRAGARRVVVGCEDPNPAHAGRGLTALREAGIEVISGVLEEPCHRLNEAFFWWIRHRTPYVMLKLGMTLDGRIATANGQSQWITGPAARRRVQTMRQWADAIMVGGETVRCDDPSLTVRCPRNWPRQPRKLVWTSSADFPESLRIRADASSPPRFLKPMGADAWHEALAELGREDVTALLLEGGGELAADALRSGIVNKVAIFIAPRILGGRGSRPAVGGPDPECLADALPVENWTTTRVGNDLLVTGYCQRCSPD